MMTNDLPNEAHGDPAASDCGDDPSDADHAHARRIEDPRAVGMDVPADAGQYRNTLIAILSRIPPHWGRSIRCDAGWFPLIARLHHDLFELDPNYVVLQVKEKFAGLRFYAAPSSDDPLLHERFSVLLDNAERLSKTICERCGKPARLAVTQDAQYPVYKTICTACTVEIASAGGHVYRPYVGASRREPRW
jgi:hypothetical protein